MAKAQTGKPGERYSIFVITGSQTDAIEKAQAKELYLQAGVSTGKDLL
jgi:hypothetical protein